VLHDRLLALAANDPSHEVCGLLFGTPDWIDAIKPCANVSPNPEDSFEVDPVALIAAHKAERAGGRRVIGCYHSHPSGMTALSERDTAAYVAGQLWLVIAGSSIAAWRPYSLSLTVSD